MKFRFVLYALVVTLVSTMGSWSSMIGAGTRGGGSSWSSGSHSSGGYGSGYGGGGGHK